MQWVVAKQMGFYDGEGVSVNLVENSGANTTNLNVAGQADLTAYTGAAATQVALQGKPVTGIMATEVYPGAAFISAPNITSAADLRNAPNCRISAATIGSTAYAAALVYMRELGVANKCTLVQLPTTALQIQGTLAGAYQATVTGYSAWSTMQPAGAHLLIDPLSDTYAKTYGRSAYQAGLLWGLKDNLSTKSAALADFIRGTFDAAQYIWTHTDKQVATVLAKDPLYTGLTVDQLTPLVTAVRPFEGNNTNRLHADKSKPYYMSEGDWKTALAAFAQYGLQGFDPTSPLLQYSQIIDMGPYAKAFPKPSFVVDPKHRTLSAIAAANLGSASKWTQLYAANKLWMDALGLKQSQIPTAKLRVGTVIAQPR
jgi:hypothetical protein